MFRYNNTNSFITFFFRVTAFISISLFVILPCTVSMADSDKEPEHSVEIKKTYSEELTSDAFFNITLLASRSVYYTLEALQHIENSRVSLAKESISNAKNMLTVLKVLSPVSVVHMTIKEEQKVIFNDKQEIYLNEVPVFEWVTHVKVIHPLIRFKNKHNNSDNIPYIEDPLSSQVWVDVEYLEKCIDKSAIQLNIPLKEQAFETLRDGIISGIRMETLEFGKDLKKTIHYLLQAYWYSMADKDAKTVKSLKKAKKHINRYAKKENLTEDPDVKNLIKEIEEIEKSAQSVSKNEIKELWFKIIKKSLL